MIGLMAGGLGGEDGLRETPSGMHNRDAAERRAIEEASRESPLGYRTSRCRPTALGRTLAGGNDGLLAEADQDPGATK